MHQLESARGGLSKQMVQILRAVAFCSRVSRPVGGGASGLSDSREHLGVLAIECRFLQMFMIDRLWRRCAMPPSIIISLMLTASF